MPYPKKEQKLISKKQRPMEISNANAMTIIANQNRIESKLDQQNELVQKTITALAEMADMTGVIKQGLNIKQSSSGEILNRPAQMHKLSKDERGALTNILGLQKSLTSFNINTDFLERQMNYESLNDSQYEKIQTVIEDWIPAIKAWGGPDEITEDLAREAMDKQKARNTKAKIQSGEYKPPVDKDPISDNFAEVLKHALNDVDVRLEGFERNIFQSVLKYGQASIKQFDIINKALDREDILELDASIK